MKRPGFAVWAPLALLAAGCAGAGGSDSERRALEPLGERAGAFEDAQGLRGADREAFFWLLERAARRWVVDGSGKIGSDLDTVTPELLAARVRQAREAQALPWAPRDEDAWRRGVLMYRVATERITDWHGAFRRDAEVARRIAEFAAAWPADPEGVLRRVVHYLNAEVLAARVAHRPKQLPDLDPQACLEAGGGRATDLAIAGVCLLRTWGVPAVLARTPLVNRAGSGDAWIVVPGANLSVKPADPAPPGDAYFAWRRDDREVVKIFVTREEDGHDALAPWAGALSWRLRHTFLLVPAADVSDAAACTARVSLGPLPEPAFLSAWSGGWLEVAAGRRDGAGTDFGYCGANAVLYLPTTVREADHEARAAGDPFVLHPDGRREVLRAGTAALDWVWTPDPRYPGAEPRLWRGDRFEPVPLRTEAEKKIAAGAPTGLYVLWKPGPEGKGQGRPVGRPFTVDADGRIREF